MAKRSHYYIFGDKSWPVTSLAETLAPESQVTVRVPRMTVKTKQRSADTDLEAALGDFALSQHGESEPVVIVGFEDPHISKKIVDRLKASNGNIKILQVGARPRKNARPASARSVPWEDLLSRGVGREIHLLSLQRRVEQLRACFADTDEIAILLQDDPDPDGLASALALRKLLNRNSQTAPIVTFGRITRPENVAMSRLLGIDVITVGVEKLRTYDKVVLVDCQPSFFKGRTFRTDVVLDHHPRVPDTDVSPDPLCFEEIREDFGALSSMMFEFLRASGSEISQRLATALIYGIKSDTFHLNREVSEFDLGAFVSLYPLINGNTLRRIERPELPLGYLDRLRVGLGNMKVSDGIVVLPLGKVTREEWIAQAADFALQIEGAEWAFGCGVCDGRVVISGRNCGYVQHCGDVFKAFFDTLGCAGGHRTMAKAMISVDAWKKRFKLITPDAMADEIMKVVQLARGQFKNA